MTRSCGLRGGTPILIPDGRKSRNWELTWDIPEIGSADDQRCGEDPRTKHARRIAAGLPAIGDSSTRYGPNVVTPTEVSSVRITEVRGIAARWATLSEYTAIPLVNAYKT